MQKQIHLVLGETEIGQLLDGLEIREQAWRNTAIYLETGESPEEFFLAEECSNEHEAQNIANIYKAIIAKIRKQLDFQKSPVTSLDILTPPKEGVASGYAIYRIRGGRGILVDRPNVFRTWAKRKDAGTLRRKGRQNRSITMRRLERCYRFRR